MPRRRRRDAGEAEARRTVKEILKTGVIGPVHEVHVWADRAWGLQDAASAERFDKSHGFYNGMQIVDRFKEEMAIPSNMHWDLWVGPAPERPYHATYFPGPRWYRWWDFGNGTMSDLGSHDNDVPYTVLDLWRPDAKAGRALAPLTIEAISPNVPVAHKELAPATLPRSPGNPRHLVRRGPRQSMAGALDRHELVLHADLLQLAGHVLRSRVGHVGVGSAVDQERRWHNSLRDVSPFRRRPGVHLGADQDRRGPHG